MPSPTVMRARRSAGGTRLGRMLLIALLAASLAAVRDASAQGADGKAGRLMLNLKLGPSIGIVGDPDLDSQLALVLDAAYAVTPDGRGYVYFAPQFQLAGDTANVLMFPLGFQYDVPIRAVRGLFVYGRLGIGYAAGLPRIDFFNIVGTQHAFLFLPELGVKYVLRGRFNFGFEPFSLPVGIGCEFCTQVSYRLLFYGGVNL